MEYCGIDLHQSGNVGTGSFSGGCNPARDPDPAPTSSASALGYRTGGHSHRIHNIVPTTGRVTDAFLTTAGGAPFQTDQLIDQQLVIQQLDFATV